MLGLGLGGGVFDVLDSSFTEFGRCGEWENLRLLRLSEDFRVVFTGFEEKRRSCDLSSARVDVEGEKVMLEDFGWNFCGSIILGKIKPVKFRKSIDENMAAATTRVEKLERLGVLALAFGQISKNGINEKLDDAFGSEKAGDSGNFGFLIWFFGGNETGFFGLVVILIEPAENFDVGKLGSRKGEELRDKGTLWAGGEGVEVIERGQEEARKKSFQFL